MITGNLNVTTDARIRSIISKGPKYRFPSDIDFPKFRREIAASLNAYTLHANQISMCLDPHLNLG